MPNLKHLVNRALAHRVPVLSAALAIALATAILAPATAHAASYGFKPNTIVNGWGTALNETHLYSSNPIWGFSARLSGMERFATDEQGWAYRPTNTWGNAAPVAFDTFVVGGVYQDWWCSGFDVRNTGSNPIQITVSASLTPSPVSQSFTIEPGTERVSLTGFSPLEASDNYLLISFDLTADLAFNNFELGAAGQPVLAEVSTGTASSITSTGALVTGSVPADGGGTISERGICYSASNPSPTTSNSTVTGGSSTNFTATLTGLAPGTTYYARAYAVNEAGTAYGDVINFTTSGSITPDPSPISVDASSAWTLVVMAGAGLAGLRFDRARRTKKD